MLASQEGYVEIVQLLIENGTNLNVKNNDGKTAMNIAKTNKRKEIFKILKKAGAK